MKYNDLTSRFRSRPFFEARELDVVYDEPYAQIRFRLSRWVSQSKLIQIRRGYYLLPPEERAADPSLYAISNTLYSPSYVSLHSALEYYTMILEQVTRVEAISPKQTAGWDTPVGQFRYFSIKTDSFRGYQYLESETDFKDRPGFFVATPEKALLDLFYFHAGEWTEERILEMRFQQTERIQRRELLEAAQWFHSPRIERATRNFLQVARLT
ncbi:MAG: hypothetical protein V3U24_11415 [Candidatus Neomarinimicrobiota bacterium]